MRIDSLMIEKVKLSLMFFLPPRGGLKCIKKEDVSYTSKGRTNCFYISMVYLIGLSIVLR